MKVSILLSGEAHELILLGNGLEFTVTDLGRSIDEFYLKLKVVERLVRLEERLSNGDLSLSGAHNTTSKEDEVFIDDTVMRESTNGSNVLWIGISLSGSVIVNVSDSTLTNVIDLLVKLGSVVVTEVTSTSNGPLNSRWMPSTDTSDLTETSMRLSGKSRDTNSANNTLSTVTTSDSNGVNHLVLLEDLGKSNLRLKLGESPINLLSNALTTINLDFQKMAFLLSELALLNLSGSNNSDSCAVFLDSLQISVDVVLVFGVSLILLSVFGEGFLVFREAPSFVESSEDTVRKLLGPDGSESTETSGSLDVTLNTNDFHRRTFNTGDGFDDILFDGLLTLTFLEISGDVSHTGLVTSKSSEVDWSILVVLGEGSNGTFTVLSSSFGHVGK
jgi:hypothetical protein